MDRPESLLIGRITVDRGASIWYGTVLPADDDEIVIGPDCNIQDLCCLHVDPGEPAILEEGASVGHHATVHGAHVGAGALIGIGAVLLGRSRVGAGSLIAAGAVVRPGQQIPAGVLAAGVPATIVRELTDADPGVVRAHRIPLCGPRRPAPGRSLAVAGRGVRCGFAITQRRRLRRGAVSSYRGR